MRTAGSAVPVRKVCPTGTIRDKFNYSAVERQDKLVPCKSACPANTDIPRYVRYVKEGKYDEAAAVIREKVAIPEFTGSYLFPLYVSLNAADRKSTLQYPSGTSKGMLQNMIAENTGKTRENSCLTPARRSVS